jgi:hypothetical protein
MPRERNTSNFTGLFPEWLMCSALSKSIKANKDHLGNLRFHIDDKTTKLSGFFPNISEAELKPDQPLLKTEFDKWGIKKELYQKTYWGLRPDFMVINEKDKTNLILIEAKCGVFIPDSTWKNPKEMKYYEFLEAVEEYDNRALLYIVPREKVRNCLECIKLFDKKRNDLRVGYGIWEEMLEFMVDSINNEFIEWLGYQCEGIQMLSQWRREQHNRPSVTEVAPIKAL